jgi:hypothetical protein
MMISLMRTLPFDGSAKVLEDSTVAPCNDADVRFFECQRQQSIDVQENSWHDLLCSGWDLNCLGQGEDVCSVVLP